MKNYYELLEVSEKASPEVIKKAYITLVKKYHPDLQPDGEKKAAEEKIKEINEAYEVLSDKIKREGYDKKLQAERITAEKVKAKINNNQNNYSNNQGYNQSNPQKKVIRKPHLYDDSNDFEDFSRFQKDYTNMMNEAYNNAYNQAYNNAYNQAYINNLKNMGYEIEYEKPFKEKVKIAFSVILGIVAVIIVGFILWLIPPVREYFVGLYNDNEVFKLIVDILGHIFNGIFNIFKSS